MCIRDRGFTRPVHVSQNYDSESSFTLGGQSWLQAKHQPSGLSVIMARVELCGVWGDQPHSKGNICSSSRTLKWQEQTCASTASLSKKASTVFLDDFSLTGDERDHPRHEDRFVMFGLSTVGQLPTQNGESRFGSSALDQQLSQKGTL